VVGGALGLGSRGGSFCPHQSPGSRRETSDQRAPGAARGTLVLNRSRFACDPRGPAQKPPGDAGHESPGRSAAAAGPNGFTAWPTRLIRRALLIACICATQAAWAASPTLVAQPGVMAPASIPELARALKNDVNLLYQYL